MAQHCCQKGTPLRISTVLSAPPKLHLPFPLLPARRLNTVQCHTVEVLLPPVFAKGFGF